MEIKKIIFYGTPEFAVPSLKKLISDNYNVVAVVTTPDKPSGRGLKINESDIKKCAKQYGINVLEPKDLKDPSFISTIRNLDVDVQIVVAFKKLPTKVFQACKYGTINLHASLLPNYRGAAPINWAIINGERESGLTTFFINERIDEGRIILNEKISINENYNAGDLHDIMKERGALLISKTLDEISTPNFKSINQDKILLDSNEIKKAPKIYKQDCLINWHMKGKSIYNFIRGLSPYPGAYTQLISPKNEKTTLKVFKSNFIEEKHSFNTGSISTDSKNVLKVAVVDGFIDLQEIQLVTKNRMSIAPFLRGFMINSSWGVSSI